ncbi:heme biosynthesis HemY N-terminal domain-containing protein [Aurantivibrio plasticivorans]
MKRLFLLIVASLFAGAFLFQKISEGSGYVLIALGNTRVEMSFWVALALIILLVLLSILVWWLIARSWRIVSLGGKTLGVRSNRWVQQRTAKGIINFIEGNWTLARKHLIRSAPRADYPLINYLAAARSSYELGNTQEAFDLLHKAERSSPDSGLAVALTQARMLLVGQKYEQCLANLERAKKIAPDHPVVLDLLQQTYLRLEDWSALKAIIPELKRYDVMDEHALYDLERKLYLSSLIEVANKAEFQNREAGGARLKKEWDAIPSALKKDVSVIVLYVEKLQLMDMGQEAFRILRHALKQNWHNQLINLVGRVNSADPKKQLLVAEGWLKERPGDAMLMLTLGRLSLLNQQWTQAKEYFESSLKLEKSAETYAELGRLCGHLGEYEQSSNYYQASLGLAADALPALPMPGVPSAIGSAAALT